MGNLFQVGRRRQHDTGAFEGGFGEVFVAERKPAATAFVLVLVVIVVWAFTVALWFMHQPGAHPDLFRASARIGRCHDVQSDTLEFERISEAAEKFFEHRERQTLSDWCAVAAPNLLIYRNAVWFLYPEQLTDLPFKLHEGPLLVRDLEMKPLPQSSLVQVKENSSMCRDETPFLLRRHSAVAVHGFACVPNSSGVLVDHEFTTFAKGELGACIQHTVDVLQGWWPCPSTLKDNMRVPRNRLDLLIHWIEQEQLTREIENKNLVHWGLGE